MKNAEAQSAKSTQRSRAATINFSRKDAKAQSNAQKEMTMGKNS
jgi:hypothetical protein